MQKYNRSTAKTFEKCFRRSQIMNLPKYYEYSCNVKTLAGHNVLEQIPEELKALESNRPLILSSRTISRSGLLDIIENNYHEDMSTGALDTDIPPDSCLNTVSRLAELYRSNDCDSIVAIGGGSVLDTAKAVNILVSEGGNDLIKYSGAGALKKKLKPLILIPTTSGTGSEATIVSVISDIENQRKLLFLSPFLLPDVAVLDSRVTLSLPPALTAQTAMDAMTHAIEAYIGTGKNPMSDSNAFEAVQLIAKNIVNVVKNPQDQDGRLALAVASNMAGMAFSNSMVGIIHTLGHSIGAVSHISHGVCMSVLLPLGLEYNLHKRRKEIGELLLPIAGDKVFSETPEKERAEKTIEYIRKMNKELYEITNGAHAYNFKDYTWKDGTKPFKVEDIPLTAQTALNDGSVFYNPEEISYEEAVTVLEAAYTGEKLDLSKIKKGHQR
jgi:alcohol dehydrogenase